MKVWQYKELEQGNEVEAYISDSDGEIVAQFWAVDAKDGCLMAAAPRLAAALKGLLDNPVPIESWDESAEEHNKRWDRNAAAITEARAALAAVGEEEA